ncbi:hypothetical protein DWW50_11235 [Eubacterium sp. AF15-50]|nr:hypothetical protein DWW50_11235 [Eubacterium sp. AF15-50]
MSTQGSMLEKRGEARGEIDRRSMSTQGSMLEKRGKAPGEIDRRSMSTQGSMPKPSKADHYGLM